MEARSRVAATAAAVVPFHCIICFDEFNLADRPPMVLPCGHTYVCLPCTKRLKRCMECREPLFVPVRNQQQQQPQQQVRTSSSYASRRYGVSSSSPQTPATPPHASFPQSSPPAQVPLPIPKNIVLLSLMEAAQRQAQEQIKEAQKEGSIDVDSVSSSQAEDDEEEEEEDQFDLNRIITGMATLSGPCGTYAVKETSLVIVPNDPRTASLSDAEEKKQEPADESCIAAEPYALEQGQTVQVVEFEDGIAKLARGEGYIVANSSQLVKGMWLIAQSVVVLCWLCSTSIVDFSNASYLIFSCFLCSVGGPLDESCRLEGLLTTVEGRGADLQIELDENHAVEASLRAQLDAAMTAEPTHPVIKQAPKADDIYRTDSNDSIEARPDTPSDNLKQHRGDASHCSHDSLLQTPEAPTTGFPRFVIEADYDTAIPLFCHSNPLPGSPVSIDNADIANSNLPRYRRSNSNEDLHPLSLGCGTGLLGETSEIFASSLGRPEITRDEENQRERTNSYNSHDASHSSFNYQQYGTPTLTSSFDCIDFRTGLSGHRALTSAHKWQNGAPRRQIRMMGEHRGIARIRQVRRTSPQSSPSFCPES